MTMPVNSFQDILSALEQNPDLKNQLRTHILTEELLQLPAQFLLLRTDVDELKTDLSVLKTDVSVLKTDVSVLKTDVSVLKTDVSVLKTDVSELKTRMNRVEGRLGNIEGNQYEERAANRVLSRAVRLGIEGAQIAFSKTGQARQDFHDAMARAVQTAHISQDEYDDLAEADLIVRGRNRRHAVVEISLGANEDDIDRVLRRSEILRTATGDHVTPVIATPEPHPALVQEAEGRNTRVLEIPT